MPDPLDTVVAAFFAPQMPKRLAVAVSGGGDSMALLVLLSRLQVELHCVTVNHGLRSEAAAEAEMVSRLSETLNIPHTILEWTDWDGKGNLQAVARDARYRLIADWARAQGLTKVALGHTLDDQAETVLMRLARGAGVDGLSAMAPRRIQNNVMWLRPLLQVERADLRAFLTDQNIPWVDDPSNEDARFERVKVRQAWSSLAPLGITRSALARVAENMVSARAALVQHAQQVAQSHVVLQDGAVRIDLTVFEWQPYETARRIFLAALNWINGAIYAPRQRSLDAAMEALMAQRSATLDGCHSLLQDGKVWVFREYAAVKDLACSPKDLFDNRWRVEGPPKQNNVELRALGEEGLAQSPNWRDKGVPRQVLLSTPAVWSGDTLVAAPVLDPSAGWHAHLKNEAIQFI